MLNEWGPFEQGTQDLNTSRALGLQIEGIACIINLRQQITLGTRIPGELLLNHRHPCHLELKGY